MNDCEIELVRRSASAVTWSVKKTKLDRLVHRLPVAKFAGSADQSELFQIAQGLLDIERDPWLCRRSYSLSPTTTWLGLRG